MNRFNDLERMASDEVLASVLNGMLPEDQFGVHAPFLEGGVEKLVLDYTERIWPELEVLAFEPELRHRISPAFCIDL